MLAGAAGRLDLLHLALGKPNVFELLWCTPNVEVITSRPGGGGGGGLPQDDCRTAAAVRGLGAVGGRDAPRSRCGGPGLQADLFVEWDYRGCA